MRLKRIDDLYRYTGGVLFPDTERSARCVCAVRCTGAHSLFLVFVRPFLVTGPSH